jgi:hypothetical protein
VTFGQSTGRKTHSSPRARRRPATTPTSGARVSHSSSRIGNERGRPSVVSRLRAVRRTMRGHARFALRASRRPIWQALSVSRSGCSIHRRAARPSPWASSRQACAGSSVPHLSPVWHVPLDQAPEGQSDEGHHDDRRCDASGGQKHREERRRSQSGETRIMSHDPLTAHVRHLDLRHPARRFRAQL